MIDHSWKLNNALDSDTNKPEVQMIIDLISDFTIGMKLLGASGGGYMFIFAKDLKAAARIQTVLTQHPPNSKARFIKMDVNQTGFHVTRS